MRIPATREVLPFFPESDGFAALRNSLGRAFKNPHELCAYLGLDPKEAPEPIAATGPFATLVTREFASRMRRGDWQDPLLLQVLPLAREYCDSDASQQESLVKDAVGDLPATLEPGLIQKYKGRALIISHGGCAIHCRYCFRRHFPYSGNQASGKRWLRILEAIERDHTIKEVILSGGDPLMSSDSALGRQLGDLEALPQINTLRIHTRLPIVCPNRVGTALVRLLGSWRGRVVVVLHINHSREIDAEIAKVCNRLGDASLLLNQSVLLAGVNDSAETLVELSRQLFAVGVQPYYLHLLDEVGGVGHFKVAESAAVQLHEAMKAELPGYLVPKLVKEIQGDPSKRWIA